MNDLKVVEKGNSGLTRNRTLACDERLNSGRSRGGTRGGPGPPLFCHQNEAPSAEKIFFRDRAPPFLRIWMTGPPPPLSQGLDPAQLNLP